MSLSVSMDKNELLEIVQNNRERHRKIFEEAIEEYRTRLIQHLNEMIDTVKAGKPIQHSIRLPQPEEHTDDYDRVIAMLARHTKDKIDVDDITYDNYVDDNWSWSRNFLANTASYASPR